MVIPFLRPFNNPHFQIFGEFVAFFTQRCDGLRFMHERKIAHRDCAANNIMLDPSGMYPEGCHPIQINRAKSYTRTQRPTRYYLIDLGLSRQYNYRDALDEPLRGGNKSAPEHNHGNLSNLFHTDIYYLGNLIRERFLRVYNEFEFMVELVDSMTDEDSAMRPMIEDVVSMFSCIRDSLNRFKLRSLIAPREDSRLITTFRYIPYAIRTARYIVLQKGSIPDAA
ncbi:hypothetical protein F5148DRAFT_752998 [Russula earlei]|uniref:Uncharacterized protein n=1 Tax=Russula earlei TaxID=71964 RepID=A0ACC0UCH9_9AGAM|nr:hypothetical protein F5148DRAFT_752998 [Russula earlei]